MSAYSQVKRQKVREVRPGENVDYFQGVDKMEYNSMAGVTEVNSYRYYNGAERVHSRAMDDWLKFSVCLSDFRNNGADGHTRSPHRPWDDGSSTVENHKRCIKALFDFCGKLGIKYWTAFDSDLFPGGEGDETRQGGEEVAEYAQELAQRAHVKLLWLAPDLHSHHRYSSGAFTSNEVTTFAQAATQIKRCLEMSQRLGAECFLLWPHQEGYSSVLQADVGRELKLFAKLLKITADYRDRLNYRCQLLLMPYHSWAQSPGGRSQEASVVVHRYMWDVTSCLYLLRSHSLDRQYRVVAPPGHHVVMASVYNMLGGVVMTSDDDQYDDRKLTLMMKCIIDQGAPLAAGLSLRLRTCRPAGAREAAAHVSRRADQAARALRVAASLCADQTFSKHLQQRYGSYYSGFGSRLISADVSMEECEDYYKKNQGQHSETARYEATELMLQRYLDSGDHV